MAQLIPLALQRAKQFLDAYATSSQSGADVPPANDPHNLSQAVTLRTLVTLILKIYNSLIQVLQHSVLVSSIGLTCL